jgi:putative spermidine/putrescine transport system substrate-binding protein
MRLGLAATAALGLSALVLAGCSTDAGSSSSASPDGELGGSFTMVSWGGTWTDATREFLTGPFTAETGIEVNIVENGTYAAGLEGQADSGNIQWDLLDGTSAQDAFMLNAEGLLADVPEDVKTELATVLVPAALEEDFGVHGPGLGYVTICATAVDACPENMEEFFDTANFPGRRTSIATLPLLNLTIAEMALGVPADEVSSTPIDIDAAFAKLEELKASVPVWWESGDQLVQIFESDEVDTGIAYNGRATSLVDEGVADQIQWNQGIYNSGFWNVPVGAPNAAQAWEFVKWWANNPEAQAKWAAATGYGVVNEAAFDYMDDTVAANSPDWPENREQLAVMNYEWYVDNYEEVNERWQEFLLG